VSDTLRLTLQAVETSLKANTDITGLVGTRVTAAPDGALEYPYIMVSGESLPWNTASFNGMQHRIRVQAFSRELKPGQVLKLRELVYAVLHRQEGSLSVAGHTVVLSEYDGLADCFPEGDGKTWQSVIEFNIVIQ
jgi:hypothetical protein